MVQWRTPKKIDAALDLIKTSRGIELAKLDIPASQKRLSIPADKQKPWQTRIRLCDQKGVGILGHALDIIGYVASKADPYFTDRHNNQKISDPTLQAILYEEIWHDDQDLEEIFFFGVRELSLVGELYLVKYLDFEGTEKYNLLSTNQLIQKIQVNPENPNQKALPHHPWYYEFRLRENSDKNSNILVEQKNVHRCFNRKSGASREAYAPTERILEEAELNLKILKMFGRIADSNSLVTKIAYLGQDDGQWMQNKDYTSQFNDPTQAIPPVVNDLSQVARGVKEGKYDDPWQLMMGPVAPTAVDLTTSFDREAREQIAQNNEIIALGLNAPATLLLEKSDTSHFHEFVNDDRLRNFASDPALKILLKFLYKHVYKKKVTQKGYNAKLSFSYDSTMRSTLNPAQMIELFKVGIMGRKGVQRHLNISDDDAMLTQDDLVYRRELLTGPRLSQSEIVSRQQYGQEANAVGHENPLTNGQKRTIPGKIDAALTDKKKEN